jgi:hypothetical protein
MEDTSMGDMLAQVAALDSRRQAQIANQVAAINRLLKGGTYDEEMRKLHELAAVWRARYESLKVAAQIDHLTTEKIERDHPLP